MADETRSGWELLYEDGKSATDDNWAQQLAGNDSITMNLELKWKAFQLLPPPGTSGAPHGAPSTSQNTLSPYGVAYPGYGNSGHSGTAMKPSSYKPQYAPQQYVPGRYTMPGYPGPSALSQPPHAPPSTASDGSSKRLLSPEAFDNDLQELKDLIEKTAKLRVELENPTLSEELLRQAAELADLETELELQRKAEEQNHATESQENMVVVDPARREAESIEELRRESLRAFSPIDFTDCVGRHYKIPYVSCMNWLACFISLFLHHPLIQSAGRTNIYPGSVQGI